MCTQCQRQLDRAIGMLSAAGRRRVNIDGSCFVSTPATATPYTELCAALLVAAKLRAAQRCKLHLGLCAYNTSAAIVLAEVPMFCAALGC